MMLAEVHCGRHVAINGEASRRSQSTRGPLQIHSRYQGIPGFNPLLKYFKADLIGHFQ